ncbi:putative Phytanoyl-CoA dioxygenase PhyH [Vibrio nigripulchritudo POn4]|uniref:phytanoyl-CoA dioxygenase family protein n=1 Tax=Vibrio nigripulchritudo TaxID=28173 RepID=UPI0003B1F0EB|nr:phytanoyl-CoA dioxygenase family protein [Vibrio nigripulchritudo]CCN66796.1 putative Phytanoyl-CoA dioxygenase PhyH [Vibrio nigripulchritudo POn4]
MDRPIPTFAGKSHLDIDSFIDSCKPRDNQNYPNAIQCYKGIMIYDAKTITPEKWHLLRSEFADIFLNGSGIVVIKNFFTKTDIIDRMNRIFDDILDSELGFGEGDHFAQAGAMSNGRIWNAFQKSAVLNPQSFIDYYKNPLLKLVSEAWLGSNYQVTAQVNIVRPGGRAQQSHRDYHLGFQHADILKDYPVHAQKMSAMLTLQGAVAHSDMPLESGPTKLLPYSQHYPLGYVSCREEKFQQYFEENYVQLPLQKGDAVFFNPAIIHAAGQNDTDDVHRSANLLQISSAFGKPMETVDLAKISTTLFEYLAQHWSGNSLTKEEKDAILTASADGYSFPTNLDTDSPIGELAPQTMKQLLQEALDQGWTKARYQEALNNQIERRQAEAAP